MDQFGDNKQLQSQSYKLFFDMKIVSISLKFHHLVTKQLIFIRKLGYKIRDLTLPLQNFDLVIN